MVHLLSLNFQQMLVEDLLWTELLANHGGGSAFDIKGKSQEDLDACILVDPAPGQGCRGKVNACKGL